MHLPNFLRPAHLDANDPLGLAVARESLRLRASQSVHSKWAIWAVCVITVVALADGHALWRLLAWALPVMALAELNMRLSRRVHAAATDADAPGLDHLQQQLWWMSTANQLAMGSTVWWLGWQQGVDLATFGTTLQLIYLGGAMVNAATHPPTFVTGAWINLGLAALFWSLNETTHLPLTLSLVGVGLVLTRLSHQIAGNFRDSLRMRFENLDLLARLAEEKRVAEEATRFKSHFLANMSHEIRTPVSAILGMSYLALKTELQPRQRDYLQIVQQCAQHLQGLTNQVLDFSKVEARMLKLEKAEFSLESVLDNVCSLCARRAADKGLAFVIDLDPELPPPPGGRRAAPG